MQLYEVAFRSHQGDIIDLGRAIVCAPNADAAADMAKVFLGLPGSSTTFDVKRVKPGIVTIDRRKTKRHEAHIDADRRINFGPLASHLCGAQAIIRATGQTHAMRKLGAAILRKAADDGLKIDPSVVDFDVNCSEIVHPNPQERVAKQALFTEHRFFQGGLARPR
jgi:hypothetical protein